MALHRLTTITLGVPDRLLNKAGMLTAEETIEMRKHPVHGRDVIVHATAGFCDPGSPGGSPSRNQADAAFVNCRRVVSWSSPVGSARKPPTAQ